MFKEIVNGEKITSSRRVFAFMFAIASIVSGIGGLFFVSAGWIVFIPSGLFGILCVLLAFFTTLADLKEFAVKIAEAVKGKA